MSGPTVRRERVPTGRRGRPSKSMIAAAMERPFCSYLHKICLNNRLEGHKYCIDHIMNDKTAPYRQCTFVHPTSGRRCLRAAHKVDRRASPLCQYHRALRLNAPTQAQSSMVEAASEISKDPKKTLLKELSHHRSSEQPQSSFWLTRDDMVALPSNKLTTTMAAYNVKRFAEDLNPLEFPTAEEIATRHNNADSDTESVDNSYDLFKNASVYSEEEVLRTLRDKMIRLRRLYIEQYSHIQYMLKEKRLKYIQLQRLEDEMYGDIYSFRNYPNSPDYKKLRAMLKYHKTFGPNALLKEEARKRKQNRPPTVGPHPHPHAHLHGNKTQTASSTPQDQSSANSESAGDSHQVQLITNIATDPTNESLTSMSRPNDSESSQNTLAGTENNYVEANNICIFSKTVHRCDKTSLPLSPYCRQHILYDNKQVLFRPCAGGIPPCLTPVVSYIRKNKCWLHTAIN
jgi:hypothetical protein